MAMPHPMLSSKNRQGSDLRAAALTAHNKIQAVWGKNKASSSSISRLEPSEAEGYALDFAMRCIWDLQRSGDETVQCALSVEDTIKLRKIVLSVLEEHQESCTSEETFEITDPVAVEEREQKKREKAIADMKDREARQSTREKEKAAREERILERRRLTEENARKAAEEEKNDINNTTKNEEEHKEITLSTDSPDIGKIKKHRKKQKSISDSPGATGRKRKKKTTSDSVSESSEKSSKKKKKSKDDKKEKKEKSSKKQKSSSSNGDDKNTSESTSTITESTDEIKPEISKITIDESLSTKTNDEDEEKNDNDDEETPTTGRNRSRNRRRQVGGGSPALTALKKGGGRPVLQRGGVVTTDQEEPLPTITIKTKLVNMDRITELIADKISEEFPNPMQPSKTGNDFLDFYHLSVKSVRPSNEDEYTVVEHVNEWLDLPDKSDKYSYCAVYDGHSGKYTSLYTRSQLHKSLFLHPEFPNDKSFYDSFVETDKRVNEIQHRDSFCCGTTALSVCIKNNEELIIGNVGDCRGFICRGGKPIEIATPHILALESEKERIKSLGGAVVWFGTWRVNGILAVSRSIGDYNLRALVIPDPDVTRIKLTPEDEFLVLASDGLWDGINAEEMIEIVHATVEESGREYVCRKLCDTGIDKNTKDNVTVVAVFFNQGK